MYRTTVVLAAAAILVIGSDRADAQGIKYMDNVPGKIESRKHRVVKGSNTGGILKVVNRIGIINQPVGYDAVESEAMFDDAGRPVHGRVGIGLSRYYMLNGKMHRQVEYPQVGFLVNELGLLMRESYFLGEDTRKANLPEMYRDTVSFDREIRNGQEVWVAKDLFSYEYPLILINPKNKPCFTLVTREHLATLWISKLRFEIEKYRQLVAESKEYLVSVRAKQASNAQLIKNLEEGIKMHQLWLDYVIQKRITYQDKLAGLTAAQRKEPAEVGTPVQQAVLVSKGLPVEKVTGDMPDEWADVMSGPASKRQKLFMRNPDFFDPRLPRTAIQVILIKDAFKIGKQFMSDDKIKDMLKVKFFPELDYKELAALMYR